MTRLWLAVAVIIASVGGRRGRRAAQRGLLSIGVASAITNGLLNRLIPRLRPLVTPGALTTHPRLHSSSPSSHAAAAAAFATATAMEAPALAAPVAALAAGVIYSRMSTSGHKPSDVVVGLAIGATVAAATTKVWPRIDPTPAHTHPLAGQTVTQASRTGQGLTVIANMAAGNGEDSDALSLIRTRLVDATVVEVDDPKQLEQAFADAARDADAIGVFGGDGTISGAAAAAVNADVPLAIFPGGTLNHFARDLGLETVDDAIDAISSGSLVEVDAGVIDGRVFLNAASFGSYSQFVEAREANENKIGKWPAAIIALAKVMRSSEPLEVSINGQRQKIWMIFIGNCSYDPPGFAPASRTRLDDGQFDIRIIDGTQPRVRSRLLWAVLTGRLSQSHVYSRRLVQCLDVETKVADNILAADGETFPGNNDFQVTKTARRLRTFAPHR